MSDIQSTAQTSSAPASNPAPQVQPQAAPQPQQQADSSAVQQPVQQQPQTQDSGNAAIQQGMTQDFTYDERSGLYTSIDGTVLTQSDMDKLKNNGLAKQAQPQPAQQNHQQQPQPANTSQQPQAQSLKNPFDGQWLKEDGQFDADKALSFVSDGLNEPVTFDVKEDQAQQQQAEQKQHIPWRERYTEYATNLRAYSPLPALDHIYTELQAELPPDVMAKVHEKIAPVYRKAEAYLERHLTEEQNRMIEEDAMARAKDPVIEKELKELRDTRLKAQSQTNLIPLYEKAGGQKQFIDMMLGEQDPTTGRPNGYAVDDIMFAFAISRDPEIRNARTVSEAWLKMTANKSYINHLYKSAKNRFVVAKYPNIMDSARSTFTRNTNGNFAAMPSAAGSFSTTTSNQPQDYGTARDLFKR
jgi:hypothetical protein